MAIDLKELLIAAQNKIGNSTSSTATKDLIYLLKTATRGDTSIVAFDSDGEFLDSASHIHRMAYHRGKQNLFLLDSDRTWKPISGNAAPSSSQAQGSTSGYTSGGESTSTYSNVNTVDKFPFSADGNATDVGDLTLARDNLSGQSSSVSGYNSGGGPPDTNRIDKFPFSSDGNATDVGDLSAAKSRGTGQSSSDNGYHSGALPAPLKNTIDKFPFASDGNATDVGDLTVGRYYAAGQSSTASGYTSGGIIWPTYYNTID